jgi:hypothetical protein
VLAALAGWPPGRKTLAVADGAYLGKHLLRRRPANVEALGPTHWQAALYEALAEAPERRKHGCRWPAPREVRADDRHWPPERRAIAFKSGAGRESEFKKIAGACWYAAAGPRAVQVVLAHDPLGQWRDEALVRTDVTPSPAAVITGYCRRRSVEKAQSDYPSRRRWVGTRRMDD